jgi:ubiquinone/menaquinone biosynthesis C-methylase UbiE
MKWEDAVKQWRNTPGSTQDILDNYFEEDIIASAKRFSESGEFKAVWSFVPTHASTLLDIGAGRGIASYAFAKNGLQVTALEPDPSNDVGAGAIRTIAAKTNLNINTVESFGEQLPFDTNTFDVVYARQVLHHAADLNQFCAEVFRVLKPGGFFIATREHVITTKHDLQKFLDKHPLHKLYGGEHAFTLQEYTGAITQAGMKLIKVLHPYASEINYAPVSTADLRQRFIISLSQFTGKSIAKKVINNSTLFNTICSLKSKFYNEPGRLYSFIAKR